MFEGGFVEVGAFVGPAVEVAYFDLSLFVDEDVVGSDISYFAVDFIEILGAGDEGVEEVPQFFFFEVFAHLNSVLYFLLEEVGVVFIADLR